MKQKKIPNYKKIWWIDYEKKEDTGGDKENEQKENSQLHKLVYQCYVSNWFYRDDG